MTSKQTSNEYVVDKSVVFPLAEQKCYHVAEVRNLLTTSEIKERCFVSGAREIGTETYIQVFYKITPCNYRLLGFDLRPMNQDSPKCR